LWKLSDDAQRRLEQLFERNAERVVPEKLIYFDHLCAVCRTRAPTRLSEGVYICAACLGDRKEAESEPTQSAS